VLVLSDLEGFAGRWVAGQLPGPGWLLSPSQPSVSVPLDVESSGR